MGGKWLVVIYSIFLISTCAQIVLNFGENMKLTVFYSVGVLIVLTIIICELKDIKSKHNKAAIRRELD